MREIHLPYGHRKTAVSLPSSARFLGAFEPREKPIPADVTGMLRAALDAPIGTRRLRDLAKPGKKVVIITSDFSRPCPSDILLPLILEELNAGGIPDGDVTVSIALGLHRPMSPDEIETMVGKNVFRRVRVINHDPDDVVRIGVTSRGTPVEIFRPVVEADLRVCLGNLEFHYFAGYSGGAKAILPGCASKVTLNANHSMMVLPEARTGRTEGNPVRLDLEEGVGMVGVDFILNVLVDGDHHIIGAVAGHMVEAHRTGCEIVASRGIILIPERADIVLASAGGHPKDVDLYQAQKALDNAVHAVQPGGIIVLIAECGEGFGNAVFEAWMREMDGADEMLARIKQEFVLGGHKAAAIGTVLKQASVFLVSALPAGSIRCAGIRLFGTADEALRAAAAEVGQSASIIALPYAASSLPQVQA